MWKWTPKVYFPLAIGLGFSIIWLIQILLGYMPYVDQGSRGFVTMVQGTSVYTVFGFITNLGSGKFLVPFTLIVAALFIFWYRNLWPALIFAGGTLSTYILNNLIKQVVQRERPSILEEASAVGYSFPSGHAMISLVCYGLACYFVSEKLTNEKLIQTVKVATFILVLLLGLSRYFINVHYITDVIAGYTSGFILLILFRYLYERIKSSRRVKNR